MFLRLHNSSMEFFQRWGREQDIATSTLGSILGESTGTEKSWLSDGEFSGKSVLPNVTHP